MKDMSKDFSVIQIIWPRILLDLRDIIVIIILKILHNAELFMSVCMRLCVCVSACVWILRAGYKINKNVLIMF